MMVGRWLAAAATVGAALIAPGAASASIDVQNLVAQPVPLSQKCTNTTTPTLDAPAGAHRDFCVSFSLSGSETVKDLTLSLPAGVIGDPTATSSTCDPSVFEAGGCTNAQRVGAVSSDLTTTLLGAPV